MQGITKRLSVFVALALLLSVIVPINEFPIGNTVEAAGSNLALKKEAFASSMYDDTGNYSDDKINDGNYETLWSDGAIKETGPVAGYYYIAVDLADKYIINTIKCFPRRDFDNSYFLHDWYIQLSNMRDFSDAITVAHFEGKVEYRGVVTFSVDLDGFYRYVRIASPKSYFTCGELEVYGEKYDPETMGGKNGFTDTANETYNAAASVCTALGIMNSADSANFRGEAMLTRAAAIKAIVSMMRYDVPAGGKSVYADVPEDYYAKDYINTAYEHGIICANDTFEPDVYITQSEFCKALEYAMGYENSIKGKVDWESAVQSVASELKLLKHVSTKSDEYLTRGMASQILFNALKAPLNNRLSIYPLDTPNGAIDEGSVLYEASEHIALYDLYDMCIVEGILTENSASSLTHPLEKAKGHIAIDGVTYQDTDGIMQASLGKSVGLIVSNDSGEVITGYDNTFENNITKVYDSSFVSAANGIYKYENENGTTKTIHFDPRSVYVLKNYAALPDWNYASLRPSDGYLEFIDNDDDDDVDVISILKPEVVIGGYILPQDGDISIIDKDGSSIRVKEPTWSRFYKNGKTTTPGKFVENDVIFVYRSDNDATLRIEGYSNTISGTIESANDETATIDGDEYKLSEYYKALTDPNRQFRYGEVNLCLLDERNRVIMVVYDKVKDTVDTYGFVCKMYSDINEDGGNITVFSSDGTFNEYPFADTVNVDQVGYKLDKLKKAISTGSVTIKNKFIKYRVNGKAQVYKIEVLHSTGVSLGSNIVYINNGYGIYNKGWLIQPLKPSTLCFTIPKIGTEFAYGGHEDDYLADTVTKHMSELSQITEKWEFYDADDLGYPSLAVRYKEVVASDGDISVSACKSNNDIQELIVKHVGTYVDKTGEISSFIDGYDMNGNGKRVNILSSIDSAFKADDIQADHFEWLNDYKDIIVDDLDAEAIEKYTLPIKDLKLGDVLRIEMQDDYGIAVERTFDAYSGKNGEYVRETDGTYYSAGVTYPQYPDAQYRLVYGLSLSIQDDTYIMSTCERSAGAGALTQYVNYLKLGRVVVCDGKGLDVYSGEELPVYMNAGGEALLFTSGAKPVCLILYE